MAFHHERQLRPAQPFDIRQAMWDPTTPGWPSPTWALAAVIGADVWKTSSFAALLILAGLQTIPDELYEAARMDGAGPWQRFVRA